MKEVLEIVIVTISAIIVLKNITIKIAMFFSTDKFKKECYEKGIFILNQKLEKIGFKKQNSNHSFIVMNENGIKKEFESLHEFTSYILFKEREKEKLHNKFIDNLKI